jgi:hypothetical protein
MEFGQNLAENYLSTIILCNAKSLCQSITEKKMPTRLRCGNEEILILVEERRKEMPSILENLRDSRE